MLNPLDLFDREAMASLKVRRDLKGKVFTPYYGCVLLRPEETAIRNKYVMEELITFFGGEIAGERIRDRCCGGGQFFANKRATERLSRLILERRRGPSSLFCPLCHMALKTFFEGQADRLLHRAAALSDGREEGIMNILVIGGGISGVSAAKVALKEGHAVTIVEAAPEPGGLMARIANCRIGFRTFFDEIKGHPTPHDPHRDPRSRTWREGTIGMSSPRTPGTSSTPTGSSWPRASSPTRHPERKGKRVLTSLEYDALIDQRNGDLPADFDRVAFVLCVGSRSREYPLCSSVCCSYTIREIKWTLQRAEAGDHGLLQ